MNISIPLELINAKDDKYTIRVTCKDLLALQRTVKSIKDNDDYQVHFENHKELYAVVQGYKQFILSIYDDNNIEYCVML